MTTLEQQARKDAEEKYPTDMYYNPAKKRIRSALQEERVIAYAEALLHERSKPHPEREELGFARIRIDALNAQLKGCEEALAQRDAKPSLMVAFNEEEIERMSRKIALPLAVGVAREAFRYANTRAVSIDKIMEKVASWDACRTTDPYPEDNDGLRAMWNDLRERLEGLTEQPK